MVLVINPNVCVSTAEVFANKRLTPRPQMMKIRAFREAGQLLFGENHLESVVRAEYPEVDAVFDWLNAFGQARMSGSGGSVFLPVDSQSKGLEILAAKPAGLTGFVARGINFHPLFNLAA